MPEPERCSFSTHVDQDHLPHLWRRPAVPIADAQWTAVFETDADEPGVFSCDGKTTKTAAVKSNG